MNGGDERVTPMTVEAYLTAHGVRRFRNEEMSLIARNVRQEIVDRLRDGRSFPTYLKPAPENLTANGGQTIITLEVGGTNIRAGQSPVYIT